MVLLSEQEEKEEPFSDLKILTQMWSCISLRTLKYTTKQELSQQE